MKEENDMNGLSTDNSDFTGASVLEVRLNTAPILQSIELYLKGQQQVVELNAEGTPEYVIKNITDSMANTKGIFALMSWLTTTLNSQVVQGNIENFPALYEKTSSYRIDIAEFIMKNLYNWEMKETDYEGAIDMIMNQIEPFLSRLVNNKERESYAATIQHRETSNTNVRDRPRFRLPFGGE